MADVDLKDSGPLSAHSFRVDDLSGWFLMPEGDGVVLDNGNKLRVFASVDAARAFAVETGNPFRELDYDISEPPEYDFVPVIEWLLKPSPETVNCQVFNRAWNLLNDISVATPGMQEPFRRDPYDVLYDKLFWGLNLPAVTPEGKHWTPTWRNAEVRLLRRVMRRTVFEFQRLLPDDQSRVTDS